MIIKKPYDSNSKVNIQIAGGEGVGYAFGIQVHKVDESNEPLKGAKFQVIRETNQDIIGEYESDANGEFTVKTSCVQIHHQRNPSSRRL